MPLLLAGLVLFCNSDSGTEYQVVGYVNLIRRRRLSGRQWLSEVVNQRRIAKRRSRHSTAFNLPL